ncbi:MAG: glycosyltransferase family 4 protein [Candidatus Eremiobacteraeota bacterium]|nr:glycosyltransferase family 4 protein [Candidatus Eremiobacteraeota bacterium]
MSQTSSSRVAFVVPRYGLEVVGGAERLARELAERSTIPVTVLTSRAQDYQTWKNVYPEGPCVVNGVDVIRFTAQERDVARFDRRSERIRFGVDASEQERWMQEQGPYAPALYEHLRAHGATYRAVAFFTYLYATSYFGLPLVEQRSVLLPLAHHEWMLGLSMWDPWFARPRAFVFMTEEERALLRRRFSQELDGTICGVGVDALVGDAASFRETFDIQRDFALYVGRIDESKGCGELLDFYDAYRDQTAAPVDLVMAGPKHMQLSNRAGVHYVGVLDEQAKWDALAAASLFVMPSSYESLSIAVLEAWAAARPALVSATSEVLVAQSRRSNGGLWYRDALSFRIAIETMRGETGRTLGLQGRRYVERECSWKKSISLFESALEAVAAQAVS